MVTNGSRFSDLTPRILSAIALLAVAAFCVWRGGGILVAFLIVLSAAMFWEYFRLVIRLSNRSATIFTVVASTFLALALMFSLHRSLVGDASTLVLGGLGLAVSAMLLSIAVVVLSVRQSKLEVSFGALIPAATFLFFQLRQDKPELLLIVIVTIVAVDVAGYFAGKMIGGPKFWPSLSPNKTWAGTVAGWISAGAVAVVAWLGFPGQFSYFLLPMLVVIAITSQLSDIAESALKRRAGVKDSSNLIPGHGGLLDRFDGMMGGVTLAGTIVLLSDWSVAG